MSTSPLVPCAMSCPLLLSRAVLCYHVLSRALASSCRSHAVTQAPQPTPPTCAADVIGRIPILKHVLGVFGLVGASSSNLTRLLKKTSLVLYVGGIAVSLGCIHELPTRSPSNVTCHRLQLVFPVFSSLLIFPGCLVCRVFHFLVFYCLQYFN